MPLYDYLCNHCLTRSSQLRSIAARNQEQPCPSCQKGTLLLQLSAPRRLFSKDGPARALTPQQALAGTRVTGPGTRSSSRNSVLHTCMGPGCSVCA
ncbi:FmdB family zinc ribbon protein [Alcaligenes sp. SDU_A2]|uniref:FmdB family zinc ribbon protein n=1 Tax=Alcaligenes sp. SDU_A2 TaxID=3136634 RepID=UPI00311D7345